MWVHSCSLCTLQNCLNSWQMHNALPIIMLYGTISLSLFTLKKNGRFHFIFVSLNFNILFLLSIFNFFLKSTFLIYTIFIPPEENHSRLSVLLLMRNSLSSYLCEKKQYLFLTFEWRHCCMKNSRRVDCTFRTSKYFILRWFLMRSWLLLLISAPLMVRYFLILDFEIFSLF